MFVPLHDGVPLRFMRTPYVTYGLIGVCIAAQLVLRFWPGEEGALAIMAGFGMIPSVLFGTAQLPEGLAHLPAWLTLFSNVLLHANIAHLVGNMLFLWVFGDNVEDAMGHIRFILFYFLCAIGGGLAHVMVEPGSDVALIGASGSVAGVIAAYLLLHPRVKIWVLLLFRIPIRLRTVWVLGFWILLQVYNFAFGAPGEISWAAHLGGLLMGTLLVLFFRRPGVPLLARQVDEEMPVDPVV